MEEPQVPELNAVVAAEMGLHARDAAVFVRGVTETGLPVTIRKPGLRNVDARSLLEVMTEDFGHGCDVVLAVADADLSDDEERAAAQLVLMRLSELLAGQASPVGS